mmetsp:Transcript_28437/g.43425  ORF Transcript_28437/g.43425 Transcript_28437/m.43425 type:complete len:88 (-) Transcript_28437:3-266(-)
MSGEPGKMKISSPFPTIFPSPQTEQPPGGTSGHGVNPLLRVVGISEGIKVGEPEGEGDCNGVMLGLADRRSQSLHSQTSIRSGSRPH